MSKDLDTFGVLLRNVDDVAALVRTERVRRGWTQQALAQACGLTRQSINNLERRRSDLATSSLLAVLDALSLQLTVSPLASAEASATDDDSMTHDTDLDALIARHTSTRRP